MRPASAPSGRCATAYEGHPNRSIPVNHPRCGSEITVATSLRATRDRLVAAGIDPDEATLESRVLHQTALGLSAAQLLARLDQPLGAEIQTTIQRMLDRRLTREPLAYIVGHREFYGLELRVDRRALIPRPETELLVEAAVALTRRLNLARPTIADVGTGSGAIAVALARQILAARVIAIDRSVDAVALAAKNVRLHQLEGRVSLVVGDLLAPVRSRFDVIVANLPYVPDADLPSLEPEVRDFEPRLALAGGPDGLDLYRRLLDQARSRLRRPGALAFEIGAGQSEVARDLVVASLPNATVDVISDYAGIPRIVTALAT